MLYSKSHWISSKKNYLLQTNLSTKCRYILSVRALLNIARIAKSCPQEHLIGFQGVKLFLLKDVTITTIWFLFTFKLLIFITIWVFGFCHNLSFWVLSQFEFLSFVTICGFQFCHNLSFFSFVTVWVLSQFEFF